MKIFLMSLTICFVTLFETVYSLFGNLTASNFTLSSIANPTKIVLQTSGNKFAVWNNQSQIQMYYVNGTKLCQGSFPQPIQRLVWPTQYKPIMLTFPGSQFYTLDQSNCQILKTFDVSTVTDLTNEPIANEITFLWKSRSPFIIISGQFGAYEIDLSPGIFSNIYSTRDGANYIRYLSAEYSLDFKYLYLVNLDIYYGTRSVRFWQAAKPADIPIRQISLSDTITALSPSSDKSSMISVGFSATNSNTVAYRFYNNGTVINKGNFHNIEVNRQGVRKAIPIGDGNVIAFFRTLPASLELVRTGDGKTIQNMNYSGSTALLDVDYRNKVLLILDGTGKILSYDYDPDDDVQPIPDPVNPDNPSSSIWIIVASLFVGVIIFSLALMYVFRAKLPQGLRERLPKCFKTTESQGKIPLLRQKNKQDIIIENEGNDDKIKGRESLKKQPRREPLQAIIAVPQPVDEPEQKEQRQDSLDQVIQEIEQIQPGQQQAEEQVQDQQQSLPSAQEELVPPPMSDAELIEAINRQAQRKRYEAEYRAEQLQKERQNEELQKRKREQKERNRLKEQQKQIKPANQKGEEKAQFLEQRKSLFSIPKEQKLQKPEVEQQEEYDLPVNKSFFIVARKDQDEQE